ncbi:MAG: hypothetical protein AB7U78_01095 [Hyphomicrobiaceae bacterium]
MSEVKGADLARLQAAFEAELARSGLSVAPPELPELFQGYCELQGFLAQLPKAPPMAAEPAVIATIIGARVTR